MRFEELAGVKLAESVADRVKSFLKDAIAPGGAGMDLTQRKLSYDYLLTQAKGLQLHIKVESKVRGEIYPDVFFETVSCTHSPFTIGWAMDPLSEADVLAYTFIREAKAFDTYLFNFTRLKRWFWENYRQYEERQAGETGNASAGRIVPLRVVEGITPFQLWHTNGVDEHTLVKTSGSIWWLIGSQKTRHEGDRSTQ